MPFFTSAVALSVGQVLSGLAFGLSALQSIQQGRVAQDQANLQAEIFRREGERARQLSELDASETDRANRRLLAKGRALRGGSGVTGQGTPLLVEEDTAAEAEFQRLKILAGGDAAASRFFSQGLLERNRGKAAKRAGFTRGASTAVAGAASLFPQRSSRLLTGSGQLFGT